MDLEPLQRLEMIKVLACRRNLDKQAPANQGKHVCRHCNGLRFRWSSTFKAHMMRLHGDLVAGHGQGLSNRIVGPAHKLGIANKVRRS
jgi:hypothetical protein